MRKIIFPLIFAVGLLMSFSSAADAQPARKSVSAAEVTGTFTMGFVGKEFRGMSNRLEVLALGRGKLRFAFDLLYPYTLDKGERSANLGTLSGEASIVGGTAIFETTEFGPCKIVIRFLRPGSVSVKQEGSDADCGFGHNVSAQGSYKKVSGRRPKFETQD